MRTKNYIQIKILKNDILPLFDPKDSWSSYVCGHFFFSFLVQALVAVFDSSTRWQQFTCHVEQLPSLHFGLAGTVGGKHCTPLQPQWWRSHLLRSPVELWKRRFGSVCLGVFCIFLISSVKYRGGGTHLNNRQHEHPDRVHDINVPPEENIRFIHAPSPPCTLESYRVGKFSRPSSTRSNRLTLPSAPECMKVRVQRLIFLLPEQRKSRDAHEQFLPAGR